ncbi:drebrin-like protein isoform X1 [Dinothrombium tinctorium]|uniref:Drebrin-like protein isoform X1 n=1 Tax=Dinothrombium tinctorium TaxID=1965070 RepID=A0A3S3QUE1_9ACAR|nr:drebrin-like protein isoform X1 [Dinothrombium tinctorium]RWS14093.1 drebrin-like protein isoform X1 [Dinothrombium tinctorium]RWS14859.1 drebrin-like protein isoform X1 [Dinothrombium tinctorium]
MAINLKKHEDELRKAWKAVLDDNDPTNWALFGYEKQANDLILLSTGDNGLEELVDQLNVASIMYAFCRVADPKTELPKYVLINWQGEGAPFSRKGTCANHINDVANFFRGAHLTINARNEDEAEPESIMQKVSMASATRYNFKERSDPASENLAPVGTNYRRVQPQREINVNERENFWKKQQEDEKRRKLDEKKKVEEARAKLEAEQRERELKAAKEREILAQKKDEELLKKREAEKNAENAARNELSRRLSFGDHNDEEREDLTRQRQNEIAKQRSEETQKLMSQRSVKNARALFEQNTSAGQLSSIRNNEIHQQNNASSLITSDREKRETELDGQKTTTESVTERLTSVEPLEDIAEEAEEGADEQSTTEKIFENQLDLEKEVFSVLDQGLKARALYDYQAADETEISFDPDDIITHIEQIDEGWWQGMAPNGTFGLFPANYVELIE